MSLFAVVTSALARQVPVAPVWLVILAANILLTGCKTDFDKMRRDHAASFPGALSRKTAALLPESKTVGLEDCVRIALANNTDARTARLKERLANLDKKIAFSNFLPRINVSLESMEANEQQALAAGGGYLPTSDRATTLAVVSVEQSVFMPETWFLYAAFSKGEDISKLLARRTRQMIRLEVTTLYFARLSQEAWDKALRVSLGQALTLQKETGAHAREGLVMPSRLESIKTLVLAQRNALAENGRLMVRTRAALLEAMGLSPTAALRLREEAIPAAPKQKLADQILTAMLNRLELNVADRTIGIRKDATRMAIAQFLPKIVLFGSFVHTSDSFVKYDNLWTYGVSGVLTVFDGFKNVFMYQAAKQRERQAAVEREQTCLSIMLEVIRARQQCERALEQNQLAKQELVAANALRRETDARWREGLLTSSSRQDAVTRQATAKANTIVAKFQAQVAVATLRNVIGLPQEEKKREQGS